MILNQPDFFARSAVTVGAISDTDTQITLTGLSTRFTDAVTAGTVRYPIGPFRISDDDGFELIAITGHVSGSTFEVERGIQGTSAEAWGDGTAVRAVVTREQVVSRPMLQSQNVTSDRLVFLDDFDRPDQDLHQSTSPQGYEWTVHSGLIEIIEGRATRLSGDVLATVPITSVPLNFESYIYCSHNQFQLRYHGFIIAFVDVDNYISATIVNFENIGFRLVRSGSSTDINSQTLTGRGGAGFTGLLRINTTQGGGPPVFRLHADNRLLRLDVSALDEDIKDDINFILDNSVGVGISIRRGGAFENIAINQNTFEL